MLQHCNLHRHQSLLLLQDQERIHLPGNLESIIALIDQQMIRWSKIPKKSKYLYQKLSCEPSFKAFECVWQVQSRGIMPGSGFIEACSSAVSILATPSSPSLLARLTIPAPLVIAANTPTLLESTVDSRDGGIEVAAFNSRSRIVHARCHASLAG